MNKEPKPITNYLIEQFLDYRSEKNYMCYLMWFLLFALSVICIACILSVVLMIFGYWYGLDLLST